MPNHTVRFVPPRLDFALYEEGSGLLCQAPPFPGRITDHSTEQFVIATCTPTKLNSGFNPFVSGGGSNGVGLTYTVNKGGATASGYAMLVALSARKLVETGGLSSNIIELYAGSSQIGIIGVNSATDVAGCMVLSAPRGEADAGGDSRWLIDDLAAAVTGGAVAESTDVYTKTAHGFITGDRLTLNSLTGGTGLTSGNIYYFHRLTSSTGYLCSTYANALAGTPINVTVDASNVSLTRRNDIGLSIATLDTNLVVDIRLLLAQGV